MNSSNITSGGYDAGDGIGYSITSFTLATFAFVINFLVSIIFSIKKKVREQTYTFLVMNLSVADLVVSSAVMIQNITNIFTPNSIYLCLTHTCLISQALFMSIYFTSVISLNCYLSAASTTWSDKLLGGMRRYAVLYVPSIIIAFVNAGFYTYRDIWYEGRASSCASGQRLFGRFNNLMMAIQIIPSLIATFVLCVLAMQAIHTRFGPAQRSQETTIGTSQQNGIDTRRKRHRRALKTLGIIFALLIILTLPLFVSLVVKIKPFFRGILMYGMLLNSAINPIVYTWRLKDFREEVAIMCCQRPTSAEQ